MAVHADLEATKHSHNATHEWSYAHHAVAHAMQHSMKALRRWAHSAAGHGSTVRQCTERAVGRVQSGP